MLDCLLLREARSLSSMEGHRKPEVPASSASKQESLLVVEAFSNTEGPTASASKQGSVLSMEAPPNTEDPTFSASKQEPALAMEAPSNTLEPTSSASKQEPVLSVEAPSNTEGPTSSAKKQESVLSMEAAPSPEKPVSSAGKEEPLLAVDASPSPKNPASFAIEAPLSAMGAPQIPEDLASASGKRPFSAMQASSNPECPPSSPSKRPRAGTLLSPAPCSSESSGASSSDAASCSLSRASSPEASSCEASVASSGASPWLAESSPEASSCEASLASSRAESVASSVEGSVAYELSEESASDCASTSHASGEGGPSHPSDNAVSYVPKQLHFAFVGSPAKTAHARLMHLCAPEYVIANNLASLKLGLASLARCNVLSIRITPNSFDPADSRTPLKTMSFFAYIDGVWRRRPGLLTIAGMSVSHPSKFRHASISETQKETVVVFRMHKLVQSHGGALDAALGPMLRDPARVIVGLDVAADLRALAATYGTQSFADSVPCLRGVVNCVRDVGRLSGDLQPRSLKYVASTVRCGSFYLPVAYGNKAQYNSESMTFRLANEARAALQCYLLAGRRAFSGLEERLDLAKVMVWMCTRCGALSLDYEEPVLCCCGEWDVRDSTYYLADQDWLMKVNKAFLPESKERYLQRKAIDVNGAEMRELTSITVRRLHARTSRSCQVGSSGREVNNKIEKRARFADKKPASRHWPAIHDQEAQEAKSIE